jgi:RHS repeat-associated protein
MDRVQTRIDPLLRQESYSYDLNGNLVSSTDRKSQVTSLTHDPLNRLKLVGYNTVTSGGVTSYESTTGYTYDAGNRMTQAVDTAGGTITEAYDNLDRLTSETTPQGSISYGYDLAGRRTSITVAGQPQITYSYDNANRLTQIAQGTSTVGFSFDNANRRSTLTLSNGVNMAYTYDNDGRVTGITYKFNAATLGNLAYSYDSLSRRNFVSGNFAQTSLPGAIGSATYDAANELNNWNGTAISYDLNGNMLSDGTNTFSWNARNQVATLNSVTLQYDAAGRRIQNAAGKSFLFDGANAVQELSNSNVLANLLSGGIDEIFTRADSSGSFTPLKDALGSTIALVDASGNIVTTYAYDPFGNTVVSGATNSNEFQYTGREDEGNGLYFYRARYYSPRLGRFINEDPLGFGAGSVNLFSYVGNDPLNSLDPLGLERSYSLGNWSARVDRFNDGGQSSFEIHVYDGESEAGIVKGADGWIGKHGNPAAPPPNMPDNVAEMINGINVEEMRANGTLPSAWRGGAYLEEGASISGRIAGVMGRLKFLPLLTLPFDELAADITLARRAKSANRSKEEQICAEAAQDGHRTWIMTTMGPLPSKINGCDRYTYL